MITSTLDGLTTFIYGYKVHHSSTAYRAISRRNGDIQRVSIPVSPAAMLSTREIGCGYHYSARSFICGKMQRLLSYSNFLVSSVFLDE